MARNDRGADQSVGEDIFDNPPAGPVGVHRGKVSFSSRFVPFVVVIVIAALLGLLAFGVYSGEIKKVHLPWSVSSSTSATRSPSASRATSTDGDATATDTDSASSDDQSSTAQPSESTSSAPEQTVNKDTAVQVVNGTSITGYAAQEASALSNNGYTNVSAANATGTLPAASVVWYQNETDAATAQDIANALGISSIQQTSGIASPVVVVLMS
jgi:cytoskeletal protein RodZ